MNESLILQRLENLERTNRRLKRGFIVSVLFFVIAGAVGAVKIEQSLDAEQFVVHDKAGNERIRLSVEEAGPALRMFDSKGRPRVVFLVEDEGSVFTMQGGP